MLGDLRRVSDACRDDDQEAMTAAEADAGASRRLVSDYVARKTGSGHTH